MDLGSLLDPFSPSGPAGADAPPSAPSNSNIGQQWSDALNDPTVRSALLSTGLMLMQPPGFGQTAAGHIARSIGAGAEALTAGRAEDMKQQEADTKSLLRESQASSAEVRARAAADTAEARLAAAGARNDVSAQRLDLERQKLGFTKDKFATEDAARRERSLLQNTIAQQGRAIQARKAYDQYSDSIRKNTLPGDEPKILPFDQFATTSGFADVVNSGLSRSANDPAKLAQDARDAIARGANPDAVKAKYRNMTGQELP